MVHEGILLRLLRSFPGSFINHNMEFIAHRYSNAYFALSDCNDELDVKCKVLEWFSRPAHKSQPYSTRAGNRKFHKFMLDGINDFLHADFTEEDMALIYQKLGNSVRHNLTVEFVNSGYEMELLKKEDNNHA